MLEGGDSQKRELKKILFIVGAGAEKFLGFPLTFDQEKILKALVGFIDGEKDPLYIPLRERLEVAFDGWNIPEDILEEWEIFFLALVDGNGTTNTADAFEWKRKALERYRKRYKEKLLSYGVNAKKAEETALNLFLYVNRFLDRNYDWLALRSIAYAIYRSNPSSFSLVSLLSTMFFALDNLLSLPTPEIFRKVSVREKQEYILPPPTLLEYVNHAPRLIAALNLYRLIMYKLFKTAIITRFRSDAVKEGIALVINFLEKLLSLRLALTRKMEISFITYNWSPLWVILCKIAMNRINRRIGEHRLWIDLGFEGRMLYLFGERKETYLFSEATYYAFKKMEKVKYESFKFLFPHGAFNIRICPKCGEAFLILPFSMSVENFREENLPFIIRSLYLSDPFPFMSDLKFIFEENCSLLLEEAILRGIPDRILCPYCNTTTTFEDTFLDIQTVFKHKAWFLPVKLFYEHGRLFSEADHVITLGYSFPEDDLLNFFIFKLMETTGKPEVRDKFLTILTKEAGWSLERKWLFYKNVKSSSEGYFKIFSKDNVRKNGHGIPDVFKYLSPEDIVRWGS